MALSTQAESLINAFEHAPGVTHEHATNLRAVINASPTLIDQVNAAVASGQLKHFAPLPAGEHAGGSYNGRSQTMNLPLASLAGAKGFGAVGGSLTFVLGHELQHGVNNAATVQAYAAFNAQVRAVAHSPAAVHDYTPAVERIIGANRRDEAGAEIAGWNAVASRVRAEDPNVTLERMYAAQPGRMADFIAVDYSSGAAQYTLKPGLTLDSDMSMPVTAANVETMGRNYFDKGGADARLGHNGNSSYANFYGAYAISVVAQNERAYAQPFHGAAPKLALDMNRLHLSESTIEQNGVDLGSNHTPVAYYDSSTTPATLHHFNHTATTHTFVPVHALQAAHEDARATRGNDPRHPSHPGHALYGQVEAAVARLDAAHGRSSDATSERVTASLYALAQSHGMSSVSDVVTGNAAPGVAAGERLFVVQGGLDSPANRIAYMPTAEAIAAPVGDTLQRAAAVSVPQAVAQQHAEPAPRAPEPVRDQVHMHAIAR